MIANTPSRQLTGDGQGAFDARPDRCGVQERIAELALEQVAHVRAELHVEGSIETILTAQIGHFLFIQIDALCRPLCTQNRDRIDRPEIAQKEYDHQGRKKRWDDDQQPHRKVAGHVSIPCGKWFAVNRK